MGEAAADRVLDHAEVALGDRVGVEDVRDQVGATDGEFARRPVLAVDLVDAKLLPVVCLSGADLAVLEGSTRSLQYARRVEPILTWLLPRAKKTAFSLE